MIDSEVAKILGKQHQLRELRRARERVRQLERELNGAPGRPTEPTQVPEFLRAHLPLRVV